ncbi:uncharacterized protein LOC143287913 [Babylonia areolata]|uniref:uncharacterized protein LOC143287913 n=1 Tax=Babylonia areolata TaxID=304850 RepID=UPI003FD692B6
MARLLLAALCALCMLGSAEGRRRNVDPLKGGGCSHCDLSKMIKDCPLDVIFLLDMSDSVSRVDYMQARNYVVRHLNLVASAFQDTQIGFMAFSNIVHTNIAIQSHSAFQLQQLTSQVQNLQQQRYGTQLAAALRQAREALKSHTGTPLVPGGRRGKLIVLVSDGCGDEQARAVVAQATQAALDGIFIVSVQLEGSFVKLLETISVQVVSLQNDINWGDLVACPPSFLPPVTSSGCGDFVIAMDGSDSVRRWESVMRDYLAYTAMRFASFNNAMGVVVFGTNVTSQSADTMIRPKRDKRQLAEQIEKRLSFPSRRGTGTTQAIRRATAFLRDLPASNASRTLFVITDGPALNPQSARQALVSARTEGFQVVVIGVGNDFTATELQTMAGQYSIVIRVDSYLTLYAVDLANYTCGSGGRCLNTCPLPVQTQDPNSCDCLCPNRCPYGQSQDPNTCRCIGIEPRCTPPFVLNQITRQCECRRTCSSNENLNSDTCRCEPRCTPPFVLNQITRQCEPRCTPPFVLNQITRQCECRRTCSSNENLNSDTCRCEPRCTPPFVLNQITRQCECRRTCSSNENLNSDTCRCEPRCTPPFVLNQITRQCECRRTCSSNENLNSDTCWCEPRCTPPFVLNQITRQCECRRTCSSNENLNSDTCRCEPRCTPPFVLNQITRQCECRRTCSSNENLNSDTCRCEPRCTPPFVLNQITRQCECRRTCSSNENLNSDTCWCEPRCTPPFVLNQITRQCECRRTCSSNENLNSDTCRCEPRCTPPFVLNQITRQCDVSITSHHHPRTCVCRRTGCQPPVYCSSPKVLYNCSCVCPNSCRPGERQNPETCECSQCPVYQRCDRPKILNGTTCQCECPYQRCDAPKAVNQTTCQCECCGECRSPQVLNPYNCQCECRNVRCSYPNTLDKSTCRCVRQCQPPVTCQRPKVPDSTGCNCVCGAVTCTYPYALNNNTCQCEPVNNNCQPPVTCQSPKVPDSRGCNCVCPYTRCSSYLFTVNNNTCQCEPVNCQPPVTCQSPKVPDSRGCNCVCPPYAQCNYPFTLNSNTCQCVCPSDCTYPLIQNPNTCACGQRPGCNRPVSCRPGLTVDDNGCTCDRYTTPPPYVTTTPRRPPTQCSAANNRCQNNQPALQDCQGRCVCYCDTSLFAGFYCDLPVRPSMCDNCTFIHGHYLAGVEGRCDLYVVCQPDGAGGFLPHIRDCPPGTIFKQDGRLGLALCNYPTSSGSCPADPCRTLPPFAKYPNSRSCGRYWQCDGNGKTKSSGCCPRAQGFDTRRGQCVPDNNCPNDCDPSFKSCGAGGRDDAGGGQLPACPYKADQANRRRFFNPKAPGLYQACAPSDFFDELLCRCVKDTSGGCKPFYQYDFDNMDSTSGFQNVQVRPGTSMGGSGNVGFFNGGSRIILYRFSGSGYYTDYFEVSLRVRLDRTPGAVQGGQMAIVSNGDCEGEETLAITVDGQFVYFKVKSSEGTTTTVLRVPYAANANGWLVIKFQYEKKGSGPFYMMTGTVNGQSDSTTIRGKMPCAI